MSHLADSGVEVLGQYHRLANAVKVRVPAGQHAKLRTVPGVSRVEPVRLYYRQTTGSVPFLGAPRVWGASPSRADGSGVRIGSIDTGIDYTHAAFGGSGDPADYSANDPTRIEPGTFPTAKVVGGFDFAGNSYDPTSSDPVRFTPFPDPDPLDCNGHGTHVAAIAAGFGVLSDGRTFKGAYSPDLDMDDFLIGPGVAPKAELYALKIFGCDGPTELILEALEWAADPDGDGDFSDRLDVVNLSLGSSFGQVSPNDVVLNAANHLAELGCVIVVAAGNSGNIFYTTAAPGVAERAISVANSLDDRFGSSALEVLAPARIAGLYEAVEGAFTRPLSEVGPLTNLVVYVDPDRACEDLVNAAALEGKIALIDRGTCFFTDKIQRAQEAGAVAVIMVNNVDEPPIIMSGTGEEATIPGVMISRADGDTLKSALRFNLRVRLDSTLELPGSDLSDQLSDSSSRGPSSPASVLKPELTAPGEVIFSAAAGTGTNGVIYSGTSMSTPHVTGAAGLLKQLHPAWSVEEIKSALMNTAASTRNEEGFVYPESRTGAGRLQIEPAVRTVVTASAEGANGLVSLSFGALSMTNKISVTRYVRLANHGPDPVTVNVSVRPTVSQAGAEISALATAATVPARASLSLPFLLTADPAAFRRGGDDTTPARLNGEARQVLHEASGQILFEGTNVLLRLPYHAILRAGSDSSATVTRLGVPLGTNVAVVTIPVRGPSAHDAPLASVFQLGATSRNQRFEDPIFAAADLLAVGAATDVGTQDSVANSTLYFGIATAESWTTPQSFLVDLEVLIDVDRDGVIDYALINASDGALSGLDLTNPGVANDVFLTVVRDTFTEELFSGGYLNIFAADERDTAPFNNSVLILSVPAGFLGLSDLDSRFSYKVVARGPDGFALVDQTEWIPFDAANPAVDTAVFGADGYPVRIQGEPIKVRVNRSAAAAGAFSTAHPLSVLVLHHFNPPGHRFDVIELDPETDDVDADGVADHWEIGQASDLVTVTSTSDADDDGFTDLQEYRAGTDPRDAESLLRIVAVDRTGDALALRWTAVSGRSYTVERAPSLEGAAFAPVAQHLAATPPLNTWVDESAASPSAHYYRVRVD